MTNQQTRETMQAYADALLSFRDIGPWLADDVTMTFMGTDRVITGRENVKQTIKFFHETAFSSAITLKSIVYGEGECILEAEFAGTHVGEFEGVAPTLKPVKVPYSVAYNLAGGRVTALRLYFPLNVLMDQIGTSAATAAA